MSEQPSRYYSGLDSLTVDEQARARGVLVKIESAPDEAHRLIAIHIALERAAEEARTLRVVHPWP